MKYTFNILPGEYWWGGTAFTKMCPFDINGEYHMDFRRSVRTQTAPLFVSSEGRFIYSAEAFGIDVSGGTITVDGNGVVLNSDGKCLRDAYTLAQKNYFPCDERKTERKFYRAPQFNSWIEFAYYPTQAGILRFAREIIENGYEPGIFIIDEGWQVSSGYGHWDFDPARFPDPRGMTGELHSLGFTVMLWITPFVACSGPDFVRSLRPLKGTDPESAKHLYKRTEDGEVAVIRWWNGFGAILDMTDPWNVEFLESQLNRLQTEYGIDGFKFDGGSCEHYSDSAVINGKYEKSHTPAECSRAWNEFGRRYKFHEYKDTFMGGGKNGIQRLHDRNHCWEGHGIDDIIPCAIVCGLIGHPFICPDMVGGGEWTNRYTPGFCVDEELFVRMAQCSALFPMMQFSWAPWEALSPENARLCLEAARLHSAMNEEISAAVGSAEKTGEPIIRCLEYSYPHCGLAGITDEYTVDENILVAPVVTKGTTERSVVFPPGLWTDAEGNVFEGGRTCVLPAPLNKLLWFRKQP